ncbi:DMT family transporter [Herbiconiux ginsengi]|uniref:EamA-like transporter family protein n=1 Tax=Herbiconiux ginsengi TaxID=381665 RepID=A0A1H3QEI1_9MICO|nr:DMT family transporter [Herbiconiux ginsengi]SDZ11700.1 EamA-like transporter family protein [Herbiconiux ginsengi]
MIAVVLLSVASSLFYGTSDFLGGVAARRLAVLPATLVNYLFGMAVIAVALLFGGWSWSTDATVAGLAAALFAIVGFITFYAAMAIGPMSLLSPVIALIQALVPVTAALVTRQGLSPLGWGAVALAVVATILISQQHVDAAVRVTLPGAVLAVVSGVMLGASVVALDASPGDSGLLPAFLEMAGGVVVLAALIGVLRLVRREIPWFAAQPEPEPVAGARQPHPTRRAAWLAAVAAGVLLGAANAFLMSALHAGNLAVVSVLSSLYPLATVLLAAIVLRERMSRIQLLGIALAILAAVLLSVS